MKKKLFGINKEKLMEFFDTKGFYVVLALCIIVVGATAYLLSTSGTVPEDGDSPQGYIDDLDNNAGYWGNEDEDGLEPSSEAAAGADQDNDVQTGTETDDTDYDAEGKISSINTDEIDAAAAAGTLNFELPVTGEIILDYAVDSHIYSKTLKDWRTHNGIDIGASKGTPVKAAADGIVREIKNDPRFGITIIVEHNSRVKTVYANLGSSTMVSHNQKVVKGDIISNVGTTAVFETADPPHLHFEVLVDGKPADPKQFVKFN